jgi:hypothetical protein
MLALPTLAVQTSTLATRTAGDFGGCSKQNWKLVPRDTRPSDTIRVTARAKSWLNRLRQSSCRFTQVDDMIVRISFEIVWTDLKLFGKILLMIWWCIDVYCHKNNDTTNFGCNHNLGLSKYPTTSIFCELVPRSRDQLHSPEVASPPICTKNEQLWTWRKRSKAKFEKKNGDHVIESLTMPPPYVPLTRWRVDVAFSVSVSLHPRAWLEEFQSKGGSRLSSGDVYRDHCSLVIWYRFLCLCYLNIYIYM